MIVLFFAPLIVGCTQSPAGMTHASTVRPQPERRNEPVESILVPDGDVLPLTIVEPLPGDLDSGSVEVRPAFTLNWAQMGAAAHEFDIAIINALLAKKKDGKMPYAVKDGPGGSGASSGTGFVYRRGGVAFCVLSYSDTISSVNSQWHRLYRCEDNGVSLIAEFRNHQGIDAVAVTLVPPDELPWEDKKTSNVHTYRIRAAYDRTVWLDMIDTFSTLDTP